jgi:hypothetical protein
VPNDLFVHWFDRSIEEQMKSITNSIMIESFSFRVNVVRREQEKQRERERDATRILFSIVNELRVLKGSSCRCVAFLFPFLNDCYAKSFQPWMSDRQLRKKNKTRSLVGVRNKEERAHTVVLVLYTHTHDARECAYVYTESTTAIRRERASHSCV